MSFYKHASKEWAFVVIKRSSIDFSLSREEYKNCFACFFCSLRLEKIRSVKCEGQLPAIYCIILSVAGLQKRKYFIAWEDVTLLMRIEPLFQNEHVCLLSNISRHSPFLLFLCPKSSLLLFVIMHGITHFHIMPCSARANQELSSSSSPRRWRVKKLRASILTVLFSWMSRCYFGPSTCHWGFRVRWSS